MSLASSLFRRQTAEDVSDGDENEATPDANRSFIPACAVASGSSLGSGASADVQSSRIRRRSMLRACVIDAALDMDISNTTNNSLSECSPIVSLSDVVQRKEQALRSALMEARHMEREAKKSALEQQRLLSLAAKQKAAADVWRKHASGMVAEEDTKLIERVKAVREREDHRLLRLASEAAFQAKDKLKLWSQVSRRLDS